MLTYIILCSILIVLILLISSNNKRILELEKKLYKVEQITDKITTKDIKDFTFTKEINKCDSKVEEYRKLMISTIDRTNDNISKIEASLEDLKSSCHISSTSLDARISRLQERLQELVASLEENVKNLERNFKTLNNQHTSIKKKWSK